MSENFLSVIMSEKGRISAQSKMVRAIQRLAGWELGIIANVPKNLSWYWQTDRHESYRGFSINHLRHGLSSQLCRDETVVNTSPRAQSIVYGTLGYLAGITVGWYLTSSQKLIDGDRRSVAEKVRETEWRPRFLGNRDHLWEDAQVLLPEWAGLLSAVVTERLSAVSASLGV